MFRLLTDFTDIRDGHAGGLIEDVTGGEIECGDWVLLHDLDSEVWGTVTDIPNGVVTAIIRWDTWGRPAGTRPQGEGEGWWIYVDMPPEIQDQPPVKGNGVAVEPVRVEVVPA